PGPTPQPTAPPVLNTGDQPTHKETAPSPTSRRPRSTWLWAFQISTGVILLGLIGYIAFFVLPRIQVLEDRLAKSEMFIHGSREAIREELDQIKEEIVQQCRKVTDSDQGRP
ncbi:hypothetical protein ACFL2Q_06875, partial [Thermodesulfobacteriota bacterium]